MKISALLLLVVAILLSSQTSFANSRSVCKKFYSKMNLSTCISRQDAARKKVKGKTYSKEASETCIEETKLVYGVATYIDYIGADKCAKEEQRRLDEQYEMRKDTGTTITIK